MSDLNQILHDYLSIRRSLGFKLERYGALLPEFIAFLENAGSPLITNVLALAWATKSAKARPKWWAARLDMVRAFARYVQTIEPRTEIPPYDLLPRCTDRPPPYIYSGADVAALLGAAGRIGDPFRAHTYSALIGLLASTGLRVGEAIALDRMNLDLEERILTVREGKFGKSREVPIHQTVCLALEEYARSRDQRYRRRSTDLAFFVSLVGTRLIYNDVHLTFFQLVDSSGLADGRPRRPRIHDLRHTFAVRTLIDWYRAGLDVDRQLPLLSTYLGHISPATTYWYLSAVPELTGVAAQRLEESLGELP